MRKLQFAHTFSRVGAAFLFGVLVCQAQTTLVIPQIADGGGWQTTLVLSNTTTSVKSASLTFFQETTGGATQNWNLSLLESSTPQNLSLPGGGTLFLHTPGTSSVTSVGWAQLQAGSGVAVYAIFTSRVPGRQDQDGTALAAASATRALVPFDNSAGFVTSLAGVNPTSVAEAISVSIQTDEGAVSKPSFPTIPARGHRSFSTPEQFPATNGQRGIVEFYSASGSLSVIALRFNPTGAFTASPIYLETGQPIIGSPATTAPLFLQLTSSVLFQPSESASGNVFITVTPNAGNVTYSARIGLLIFTNGTATNEGQTLTFNSVQPDGFFGPPSGASMIPSGGELILTLVQTATGSGGTRGNVTGSWSVTGRPFGSPVGSSPGTISGTIVGTYSATLPSQ